jgi:hypothetical protein
MSRQLATRHERAFERTCGRHVGDVYHYALAVLSDPLDAESATRATFASAYRSVCVGGGKAQLNTLLGIAYEVCRRRGGHARVTVADFAGGELSACSGAELAISRHLDGRLSRSEKRLLRAHLRDCEDCESFARRLLVQRVALRSIASIPVPRSLRSFGAWKQERKFLPDPASP